MKIVMFCSAFNGLSQRAWTELRASGHDVTVHLASDAKPIEQVCRAVNPDLVICPFLKDRVPEPVWRHHRTIIIHPGPMGDRGPSSLDWAIAEDERRWGVTALQAVEEMDAGPIWATRTFPMPADPIRKGALYNGPVADAAIELINEVVAKANDPAFEPTPLSYDRPDVIGRLRPADVIGRLRPTMSQADRAFSWEDSSSRILRSIRAADGSPGVRTHLADQPVSVYNAHPGPDRRGTPGSIIGERNGAVLVATGDGSLWIGHARSRHENVETTIKLPAAAVLRPHLQGVPALLPGSELSASGSRCGLVGGFDDGAVGDGDGRDISYRRMGKVGILTFDFYNGAMSTNQCRRLTSAFRRAASQDTNVLVLRGGEVFSNGIDLNTIEASNNPAAESWANINAIDDLCRAIITCTNQLTIASVGSNAGAGGVMLALGADQVHLRQSVVLNPHYATMGLYGSEYWTYVLPRRVGQVEAERLTDACLPIGADYAHRIGLADRVIAGNRDEYEDAVLAGALSLATGPTFERMLRIKQQWRRQDEHRKPLEAYRNEELGQMSRDMFDDRSGFAEARQAFVHKRKPSETPAHLAAA